MTRILIAEDEPRIASFVEKGLQARGFTTVVADDGCKALAMADSYAVDLLVLDVGLPRMDGFSVLHALRDRGRGLPVVILGARPRFDCGADDYLPKPFHFEDLLARIRALLRAEPVQEPTVLKVGDVSLDLGTRRMTQGPRTTDLTAREFALAEAIFSNPRQVLSREQLVDHVWGYAYEPGRERRRRPRDAQ